jgi:hypothetical protein
MKDKKFDKLEFLTGFIMGAAGGFMLQGLSLFVYRAVVGWLGRAPIEFSWWMGLPIPAISAILMGRAIASLHLEDY